MPLILLRKRADRLKTILTVTNQSESQGPLPCLTYVGPPKMDGSWCPRRPRRVLTKCGPLEKGMANHFSIPALRTL